MFGVGGTFRFMVNKIPRYHKESGGSIGVIINTSEA